MEHSLFVRRSVTALALAFWVAAALPVMAQPDIEVPNAEHEFGEVDNEESVEAEFIIRNAGTEPLEIDKVSCSCGCTVPRLRDEDKVIAPGKEIKVAATLSLKNRQGKVRKTCTVFSNDPEDPQRTLTFSGTAVAPIMYEPRTVNFGKVIGDDIDPKTITVRANEGTFKITEVSTTLDQVETALKEVEPGKVYEITATASGEFPQGSTIGNLVIKTDHPKRSKFRINIYAMGVGQYDVSPSVVTFRQTNQTESNFSPVVRVSPGQIEEFEIEEVIAPVPSIGIEVMPRPQQNSYLIKLYNVPTDDTLEGKHLLIHTSSDSAPEIKVPFRPIPVRSQAAAR